MVSKITSLNSKINECSPPWSQSWLGKAMMVPIFMCLLLFNSLEVKAQTCPVGGVSVDCIADAIPDAVAAVTAIPVSCTPTGGFLTPPTGPICANTAVVVQVVFVGGGCTIASCDVNVIIQAQTAPTADALPAIGPFQCLADVPAADPATVMNETSNCGGVVTVTVVDTNDGATGANGDPLTITRTFTLTDDCGTTTDLMQIISVEDTTAPTFTCPGPQTISLNAAVPCEITIPDLVTGIADEADNCGSMPTLSQMPVTGAVASADGMTHLVTITAIDGNGNTNATCMVTLTADDTTAPTFTCPGPQTISLNATAPCEITIPDLITGITDESDACGTATLSQMPAIGAIASADGMTHVVTITAIDGNGNTNATCMVTLTADDITNPIAVCANIGTVALNGTGSFTLAANAVAGASTDNCGVVSATSPMMTYTCANIGTQSVTLTVMDAGGNSDTETCSFTVADNTAPTLTCPFELPINSSTTALGDCEGLLDWDHATVIDNCAVTSATVTYSDDGSTVNFISNGGESRQFPVGNTIVTYTVSDGINPAATCSFTVTVIDDEAAVANCQNASINLDASGQVTLFATDIGGSSTDNCGNPNPPVTMDIAGLTSGASSFIFDCNIGSGTGTYNVVVTADDGSTATSPSTCTATVTVNDVTDPVARCQNITRDLNVDGDPITITAADIDNDFISSSDNCGTPNLTLIGQSSFDCADAGTSVSVTLRARDAGNRTDFCSATVTIEDNIDPVVVTAIDPMSSIAMSYTCETLADTSDLNTVVTATDNCGGVGISYSEMSTQGGNPSQSDFYNYTITKTWTATDNSGNTGTSTQEFIVEDNTPPANPMFSAASFDGGFMMNDTINTNPNDCFASVVLELTSLDDCADFSDLDISYRINGGPSFAGTSISRNFSLGLYSVVFTADDPSISSMPSLHTFTFTVADQTPPTVPCINNLNFGLPSSGVLILNPLAIAPSAFDNCTGLSTLTVSPDTLTCDDVGTLVSVTVTAVDGFMNSNNCTTTVSIQENNAPVVDCVSTTVTLGGDGSVSITPATVDGGSFDDCDPNPSFSVSPNTFDEMDLGSNLVTLTVTDNRGNVGTDDCLVTVALPPTCFDIGEVSGGAGEIVQVPVTVEDFTAVNSFQFRYSMLDEPVGEFVGISSAGLPLDLPGFAFTTVLVPEIFSISTSPIDSILRLDTLDLGPPVIDTLVVDQYIYDTIYNFNDITVGWGPDGVLPPGVTLPDSTVIFYIDVLLTGNLSDSSYIEVNTTNLVTEPQVNYEYNGAFFANDPATLCLVDGQVKIGRLLLSGLIYTLDAGPGVYQGTPNRALTVGLADVELYNGLLPVPASATFADSVQTASDGIYEFNATTGGDYSIIPSKNTQFCNGLDVGDVTGIQQHAVGDVFLPNTYLKIAADMDNDNAITFIDATLLLQQVINGCATNLIPSPQTASWRFVDDKQVLPFTLNAVVPPFDQAIDVGGLISDAIGNDFIAVKMGNVIQGNMFNPNAFNNDPTLIEENTLTFQAMDQELVAGEEYEVVLSSRNFNDVIAYQWALQFDQNVLSYNGVETAALGEEGMLAVSDLFTVEGVIPHAWFNRQSIDLDDNTQLFTFRFTALESGSYLSEVLDIVDFNQLNPVAYTAAYDPMAIELEFSTLTSNDPNLEEDGFSLYQNQPNPFKDVTVIGFQLPEATEATLSIMDAAGRLVKQVNKDFAQGYNEVSFTRNELNTVGVLYYELKTSTHTATKKMIIID